MTMNPLDKAIAVVSPRWAMRRLQYRHAAQALDKRVRNFEAASKGRRTDGWRTSGTSANGETAKGATLTRNRARDLARNNAYAAKALTVITSNTVGTGISGQARGPNKARVKQAATLWQEWAETPACDFEGRHDLSGLQSLVMETVARDGEAIIRFRRDKNLKTPLQLQILEPDFLDITRTTGDNGNPIIQGVEVDKDTGKAVAVWLYEQHPGDTGWLGKLSLRRSSQRVPIDQVARVFRQDRAGQLRGVSWLAPIIIPLRDLDEFEDARLIAQKIAASFAVFVHDATDAEMPGTSDGKDSDRLERIEPGIVEYLPPGKSVSFAEPPSVEGFGEFVRGVLRKVAAGIGITYESLTGDLSQTNFSGGRMGWIEFYRNIESWRWKMLIPQMCIPTWEAFKDAARYAGHDLSGVEMEWTAPHRELINPKEEIAAMLSEVRAGFKSLSEVIRERGYDPETVFAQIAADVKKLDELGLVLDSDPRKTTQQGQPRDKAPTPAKAPET
jgi:lambda family phage portal protein